MVARVSWLWKRKCIQTWTDEIFLCPVKDQSLESTWIPIRKSFDFLNLVYFHFWSGSKSKHLHLSVMLFFCCCVPLLRLESSAVTPGTCTAKVNDARLDFMSTSVLCPDSVKHVLILWKTLAKSVSVSKQRAFFVLDSLKGWGDWPFSRGRQGSPFPRGLPTRYPTAMWAAPEMNPTGRASSVKEEEQQHCKPIVLQHHSQFISMTRP